MGDARFLADEHVPHAVVSGLQMRGIDAVSVAERHLLGQSDRELLEKARVESRVIVTRDPDFLRLHAEGRAHAGIVFFPQDRPVGELIRRLALVAQILGAEGMAGHVEFV
jgi:hypothetical protein